MQFVALQLLEASFSEYTATKIRVELGYSLGYQDIYD
jgi:hypothetical protein